MFYYPFNVFGDDSFYSCLNGFKWYYQENRWEFDYVYNMLNKGETLLEIGCGNGYFLQKMVKKGLTCKGLEISEININEINRNLDIENERIETYSMKNEEKFDIVCTFQVLEHISNIKSFIDCSLLTLRKSGLFIVCVPNNDSFIKDDLCLPLNMPPHHMGLWNYESLYNLQNYFNMELVKIETEKLSIEHIQWFKRVYLNLLLDKIDNNKYRIYLNKVFNHLPLEYFIKLIRKYFLGHSIIAVYKKC